ncbi:DUF4163 domain-containing protein [Hyunsoonleella flava]|uniref:DUF4163 domain-containing protein n=1 Tax=Hyunsoonleella flava TaxID=2527939 RepID=A0A4Q9FFX4_9FLAO|nr:DUF3298 domain-containing protein [Hyunsoonleella flava]TBN00213.1 DUF4163 domain-containing protein [Hyunsoonleella flava]
MSSRILSFFIILLIFSCKKEEKLTFSEIEITTENNALVRIFIPEATGNTTVSEAINSEIESFIASTLTIGNPEPENTPSSLSEQIDAFNTEFNNFIKDFPASTLTWEAQIDGEVMYQSDVVISIAITSYMNTGGAHGNTAISFLNFDTTSGKQIANEALFTDIKAFKNLAKRFFDAEVTDKTVLFEPDAFNLPANIGFSEEGVILLYNPYEIAPYATGIIEFTIPFEKAKDYLTFNSF